MSNKKKPYLSVQTYISVDTVDILDQMVEREKNEGDKQASRNKIINEAIDEYLARRSE